MAAVDRRQGRWDEAVSNFERARQLDPHNGAVIWNLAETYFCLCRFEEAERTFATGLTSNPHAHLFSLASAAIDFKKNGNTTALHAALKDLPRDFDPGGAVTTIAVRLSLMNRDYDEAARWLGNSGRETLNDAGLGGMAASIDGYSFPRSWYEGLIARGRGDESAAQQAFTKARAIVYADLRQWPDDAKTNIMLALVDAALGRREDAIKEKAGARLSFCRFPRMHSMVLPSRPIFAVVYAQVGEHELAFEELAPVEKCRMVRPAECFASNRSGILCAPIRGSKSR